MMITMGRAAGEDRTAPHSRSPKTHQPDDIEFRLLGPVGLWAGDTFVGPATPQQRSVLALESSEVPETPQAIRRRH
ncbi:hypothetical protein [Nonomuraea sp. NPDC049625]|uniref:hypothetical protein n=1 Tax=Nonomuraea sp. NPDC049625 TaxID=3155775 RepID=UPI00341AA565